jgi:hypothetical protein
VYGSTATVGRRGDRRDTGSDELVVTASEPETTVPAAAVGVSVSATSVGVVDPLPWSVLVGVASAVTS